MHDFTAPPTVEAENVDLERTARDSWSPVDLGPYLRGEIVQPDATVGMFRTDGRRLLYPGREHYLLGETESGKTWLALACVAAEVRAGNDVLYLHFEESDPASTIERLRLLDVTDVEMDKHLRFVAPACRATLALLSMLLDPAPSLAVLDGVTEGMGLYGLKPREEDSIAAWRQHIVKPCTRAGAAVVQCDHVVKSAESRGRYALGSVHKVNGADGSVILLENAEPFGKGQRGRSHVYVTKDRPGQLRQHGRPDPKLPGKTFLGELVADDSQFVSPDFSLRLFAPSSTAPDPTTLSDADAEVRDAVVGVLAGREEQTVPSWRALRAAMTNAGHSYRDTVIRRALDELVEKGEIAAGQGRNRSTSYTLASASQVAAS